MQAVTNSATQPVGAKAATFHCPRCGGDYPRTMLTRYWSEWGRVCTCAVTGVVNDHCSAFDGQGAAGEEPAVSIAGARADEVTHTRCPSCCTTDLAEARPLQGSAT